MNDARRLQGSVPVANPVPEAEDSEIDLLGVMRTLWRGKWWILLCVLLAMALGGYYAFSAAVPIYTAKSVVALEDREGEVIGMEAVMGGLSSDQATINTEMEVIRSRELLGRLVQRLDLLSDPEFNPTLTPVAPYSVGWVREKLLGPKPALDAQETFDATVDRVLEALRVSNVPESYVFQIFAETTSPQKSARIANVTADLYISDQLTLKREATEKATNWLGERVASLKSELEDAETRLKNFTASAQLVSPEALAGLNMQLKDFRTRLADKRLAVDSATQRVAQLEQASAEADPRDVAALAADPALERLAQGLEAGTASREAFDARLEQVIDRARAEQVRESRQVEVIEDAIADLEEQIQRQSNELVTQQQLEREVAASALIYESFLSRMKEISVQEGLQEADARMLSQAVVRKEPTAPRKGLVLALAGLLGLLVGSGSVLLRERMQNVFRTAEELERSTGLGVLGQIPKAPVTARQKLLSHIVSKPTSAFSEAVRNLRTSILLSDVDSPPRVVMLTSSVPGEGKTTQSLSLARNISLMGQKVLLIEADIRRRTFSEYFDIPEDEVGLVSAVTGSRPLSDVVIHSEELGMDVLLGEKAKVNAADFFSSKSFAEFLTTAREAYDVVILDTPPVLVVPDARVIGQLADAIVYIVRWDHTPRTQVAAGLRSLQSLKMQVTGLVLTQVDPKGMKRYGYGSYGTYGSGYYDT